LVLASPTTGLTRRRQWQVKGRENRAFAEFVAKQTQKNSTDETQAYVVHAYISVGPPKYPDIQ